MLRNVGIEYTNNCLICQESLKRQYKIQGRTTQPGRHAWGLLAANNVHDTDAYMSLRAWFGKLVHYSIMIITV